MPSMCSLFRSARWTPYTLVARQRREADTAGPYMNAGARLVLDADRRLADHLDGLAAQRMVFFAGLPGTGKSFLVHQLTHLAVARGRRVHLLQWDVARPMFEA